MPLRRLGAGPAGAQGACGSGSFALRLARHTCILTVLILSITGTTGTDRNVPPNLTGNTRHQVGTAQCLQKYI